jgi:hypothetical protein
MKKRKAKWKEGEVVPRRRPKKPGPIDSLALRVTRRSSRGLRRWPKGKEVCLLCGSVFKNAAALAVHRRAAHFIA